MTAGTHAQRYLSILRNRAFVRWRGMHILLGHHMCQHYLIAVPKVMVGVVEFLIHCAHNKPT